MPETAVVIRTRNEERWLGTVLLNLTAQTYKNIEIIIVDNESTDRTLEIAKEFPVKIVSISEKEFNYPCALNRGVAAVSPDVKYIAIISGHSIPYSKEWLSGSLINFADSKVAGVYGYLLPLPGATLADKLFMRAWIPPLAIFHPRRIFQGDGMGVLGFTNAIIQKKLWDQHNFDETYGAGGEDGEWVRYWTSRGYHIVKDWKCTVRHSHNLNFSGWTTQWKYWSSLGKPHAFERLSFRKDGSHKT